jgi:hypothetical protein
MAGAVVSTQTVVVDTKQIFTNYSTAIDLTGKINAFAILNSSNGTKITANVEHSIDGLTWTMFDDLFSILLVPHRNKVIEIPDEHISKMPFIRLSFRIEDTDMISSTITINVYATQNVPGASFVHITGAATTVIKSGAGTLNALIVNTSGLLPTTATLYDNTSGSGTVIAVIDTTSTAKLPVPLIYNLAFTTGLTIVTAGSGADITVTYR